jgi:hypothetical protein
MPFLKHSLGRASLALLALVCLPSASPSQEWIRVRSPHFVVATDAGEKRGREIALKFEQLRLVFAKLLSTGKLSSPVPMRILAFRNLKGFNEVAPLLNGKQQQNVEGFFLGATDLDFIALNLSMGEEFPLVYHEYSHALLRANFQQIPMWFNEGFATYYQTIRIEKTTSRLEIARNMQALFFIIGR